MSDDREGSPPLLSVVVPIYNVELWLAEFLESLTGQTFLDWEAILVIDGSPDRSEEIARGFAARDSRISVHTFSNGGVSMARNRGFALASGEFVTFPDPDDILTADAYELLVGSLLVSGSDIATAKGEDFYPDGRRETYWAQRSRLFTRSLIGVNLRSEPELVLDHVTWNKVFRTSLLRENEIDYPVGANIAEDVVHSLRAVIAARAVDVIPEVVYLHRRRDGALTSNLHTDDVMVDWMDQTSIAVELILELALDDVSYSYFIRLLGSELWTRVRSFSELSNDTFVRFEHFTGMLLAAATTRSLEFVPERIRVMTELLANGSVRRMWRTPGFALNPLKHRLDSPVLAIQVMSRSASRLSASNLLEARALAVLLDSIAQSFINNAKDFTERQFDAVFSDLRPVWAYGISLDQVASDTSRPVLRAAFSEDRQLLRSISQRRIRLFEPVITAIERHGNDILLVGELVMDVAASDDVLMEAVLRSRTSSKVRAVGAVHWNRLGAEPGTSTWRVSIVPSPDMLDEEWVVWLRASRDSLSPIQARISVSEELARSVEHPLVMKSTIARVLPDDGLTMCISPSEAAHLEGAATLEPSPLPRLKDELPDRIWVFPYWKSNPYLEMLYLASQSQGVLVEGATYFDVMLEQLSLATDREIFHLHWTAPISQRADSEAQSIEQVEAFMAALLEAKSRGVQVYWTVHNKLPHVLKFRRPEIVLCQFLAETADVIHVLSGHTVDAVSDLYDISASELLLIEHSSYLGVYGSGPGREAARAILGIADDETAVLFLGRLLPYKGVITLLQAMQRAGERREKLVLLLAGDADPEYLDTVLANMPSSVRVISSFESVPDDEIGLWFSAADVEALPYEEILNSGSLYLAATFSLPVLMPNADHLRLQFANEPWVLFFDRSNPIEALANAIVNWNDVDGSLAKLASAAAHANTPFDMSTKFVHGLARLRNVRRRRVRLQNPDNSPVL